MVKNHTKLIVAISLITGGFQYASCFTRDNPEDTTVRFLV